MLDAVRAYDVWIQAHPADSGGRSVFRGLVETCANLLPNLVLRKTNITSDSNNLSLREATANMQRYARAVLLLTAMPKSNTKVAGTASADTFGILRLEPRFYVVDTHPHHAGGQVLGAVIAAFDEPDKLVAWVYDCLLPMMKCHSNWMEAWSVLPRSGSHTSEHCQLAVLLHTTGFAAKHSDLGKAADIWALHEALHLLEGQFPQATEDEMNACFVALHQVFVPEQIFTVMTKLATYRDAHISEILKAIQEAEAACDGEKAREEARLLCPGQFRSSVTLANLLHPRGKEKGIPTGDFLKKWTWEGLVSAGEHLSNAVLRDGDETTAARGMARHVAGMGADYCAPHCIRARAPDEPEEPDAGDDWGAYGKMSDNVKESIARLDGMSPQEMALELGDLRLTRKQLTCLLCETNSLRKHWVEGRTGRPLKELLTKLRNWDGNFLRAQVLHPSLDCNLVYHSPKQLLIDSARLYNGVDNIPNKALWGQHSGPCGGARWRGQHSRQGPPCRGDGSRGPCGGARWRGGHFREGPPCGGDGSRGLCGGARGFRGAAEREAKMQRGT